MRLDVATTREWHGCRGNPEWRRPKVAASAKELARPGYDSCSATEYDKGLVKQWVQQNHDGLAQKAGFPLHALNEIHGSWFDIKNPVKMMDDTLRPDLLDRLVQWSQRADLTIAMGTFLCGMTSDTIVTEVAVRPGALGVVIINLQKTKQDHLAALRIFAPCDVVMAKLRKRLRLRNGTRTLEQPE